MKQKEGIREGVKYFSNDRIDALDVGEYLSQDNGILTSFGSFRPKNNTSTVMVRPFNVEI
jgi:hypothetical protein